MELCVKYVGGAQAERIHRAVRNLHSPYETRVHRRFHAQSLLRVQDPGIDAGRVAGLDELFLIVQTIAAVRILRQGYEYALGVINAVAGNTSEYHILLDTLGCGFAVLHGIPRTAVQQAVVAAGRAVRNVIPFDQQDLQAPECAVTGRSGSGDASSDHNDVKLSSNVFHS